MTDYNDGKWHNAAGTMWPVHEKTMAERIWVTNTGHLGRLDFGSVGGMDWASQYGHTTAFRVVKAYREPRECWSYGEHICDTEAEAVAFRDGVAKANPGCGYETHKITKWREVLE